MRRQQFSGVRMKTCRELALNAAMGVSKAVLREKLAHSGTQLRTQSNNTKQSIVIILSHGEGSCSKY